MRTSRNGWCRRAGVPGVAIAVVAGLGLAGAGTATADDEFTFDRVAGDDRYATSAQMAREYGDSTEAILVNGEPGNYADALSANYLSGERDAPILLTMRNQTPQSVLGQLKKSGVDDITLVGGPGVISRSQAQALQDAGYTVDRVAGADRFATNAAVIRQGGDAANGVGLVATGLDFPDALSAGPVSYQGHPLALSGQDDIDDDVVQALQDDGVRDVLIFGGEAVVGQSVVTELENNGITVRERFAGEDRSETSTLASDYAVENLGFTDTGVNVASGYTAGFGADALAGGPLTGKQTRPLLITADADTPDDDVISYLEDHAGTLTDGTIAGGTGAISTGAQQTMEEAEQSVVVDPPDEPTADTVTAGGLSACQLQQGTVECWGKNDFGQLGDGTRKTRVNPQQVGSAQDWLGVSSGGATTCGIRSPGQLFCWGLNNRGQLGTGDRSGRQQPARVGSDSDWRSVSAGWWHSCGIRDDGSAWCWGNNDFGQLGIGSHRDQTRPVRVDGGHTWSSLTVGQWHTCGIRTDGTAWCWGASDLGQIATSNGQRRRPHRVGTADDWVELSAGTRHTCGVTAGGDAFCWGLGHTGQLGRGGTRTAYQPVRVDSDASFVDVSAGDGHTCALDAEGAGWCWGDNRHGELGITEPGAHPRPVRVPGTRGASVATGWMHACFRREGADRPTCVGNNEDGQLATGDLEPEPGVPAYEQPSLPRQEARVATYNILGSQHTAPRAGRSHMAPWRLRLEWSMDYLDRLEASIVGFQELQPAQYEHLVQEYNEEWNFHPRTSLGRDAVLTNMMWRRDVWEVTERAHIDTTFFNRKRERPIVRLRHEPTGQHVWVLNVHNSPSTRNKSRQDQRDRAVRAQVERIQQMRETDDPVLFLGDMNERRPVFCKVTGNTDLEAANGGSYADGSCDPPSPMRVDWIFGSPVSGDGQYLQFSDYDHRRSPLVRRLTDHPVITADFRLEP